MRPPSAWVAACVVLWGATASAHRLDEYLQATLLSVDGAQLHGAMRLIPGVSVLPAILAGIDINADGTISAAEEKAYAGRVLGDLFVSVDGTRSQTNLSSASFPTLAQMREGLGEIHIEFDVPVRDERPEHRVLIENRHQIKHSVYLVNCLVPDSPGIQIVSQTRNAQQNVYQLDYVQTNGPVAPTDPRFDTRAFVRIFQLGMEHIAEGTDHLLFLLALLLPAPRVTQS